MAPGESFDILIVVRELWIASEIEREIMWEGKGALHADIPGRDWKWCKTCVVPIPSRCCLPKALNQKLAVPLFLLNLMGRGCLFRALLAGLVTRKSLKRSSSLPLLHVSMPPPACYSRFPSALRCWNDFFLEVFSAFNWKLRICALFVLYWLKLI